MFEPVLHNGLKGLTNRDFDGYRIISSGRRKVMLLLDEENKIISVKPNWSTGVIFSKYGATITPACINNINKIRNDRIGLKAEEIIKKPESNDENG